MSNVELSPELKAMAILEGALCNLSEEIQQRVLRWACERFQFEGVGALSRQKKLKAGKNEYDQDAIDENEEGSSTNGLAEFYDQVDPESDADKALVVAYWYQFRGEQDEVEAQRVNRALKHLGQGVGNITRAFEALKGQKPALIVQTRKEGTTKQARKKFKVTTEGKKAIEKMLTAKGNR